MQELQDAQVQALGLEDTLEESNPLQYSFMRIPWIEETGGLQSMGSQRVGHDQSEWACTWLTEQLTLYLRIILGLKEPCF